jgi:hypothetical protein
MTQPTACIRCKGTALVSAAFDVERAPRLVVDDTHDSPIEVRVCLACGAVLLTATEVGHLRAATGPGGEVQEFDF